MSSELENSGIRVAVGDCSVTERGRWRPPYQTGKTVHVHAKHYKHNEDGRTAPDVCGNDSVPLIHSGNVVTRIGIHTYLHTKNLFSYIGTCAHNQNGGRIKCISMCFGEWCFFGKLINLVNWIPAIHTDWVPKMYQITLISQRLS